MTRDRSGDRTAELSHLIAPSNPDEVIDADTHARQHRRTREANQAELVEDYVELIADLIDATGEARLTDLAQRLDVRPATARKMVDRLQRDGFVTSQPYRSIFLTESGRALAEDSRRRHTIVLRFLLALGVSEEMALVDAEGIEHHVSEETLSRLEALTATLEAT